jgi:putative copper export protein
MNLGAPKLFLVVAVLFVFVLVVAAFVLYLIVNMANRVIEKTKQVHPDVQQPVGERKAA